MVANDPEQELLNNPKRRIFASTTGTVEEEEEEEAVMRCCHVAVEKPVARKWAHAFWLVAGIPLFLWGTATLIWTPFEILMNERLRMLPGFPPYEWWRNPPDEVVFRVYLFNYTNAEEFLTSGVKMEVSEVGPIVFMEKLTHSNVTFNPNGTMTYTATRRAIFLRHMNHIDLNTTVVVPNWALLGIASYISDRGFFVKLGFNLMVRTVKPKPFVTVTIQELLWNFTDPMLDAARRIVPFMVPIKNLGILSRIYSDFTNTVTVYVGSKFGHRNFFLIDRYDGSRHLPNYGSDCGDTVNGSTEGVAYPQYIERNSSLRYWRKTLCKNAALYYERDITNNKYGVLAYKFTLPKVTFRRTRPSHEDCYRSEPTLPNGLSDVSKCHYGFPLASSFPHFLHDEARGANVSGLAPNVTRHGSFLIVEPMTGVPLESMARSQSNLIVHKLVGFHELASRFSESVIPMFWLEYNQVGLPWYIASLIYFQVNVLPIVQWFFSGFLLLSGVVCVVVFDRYRKRERLMANKVLVFEKELFITSTK